MNTGDVTVELPCLPACAETEILMWVSTDLFCVSECTMYVCETAAHKSEVAGLDCLSVIPDRETPYHTMVLYTYNVATLIPFYIYIEWHGSIVSCYSPDSFWQPL